MGQIVSLVRRPVGTPAQPADHFNRVPLESTQLIAGYGIEDDAKGGHPKRQLNIMSAEVLQALAAEGFMTDPGQMGEQIIVSGIDIDALPSGTHLRLGSTARVEVIEPRTGCGRFEAIQNKSRHDADGRMGVIARVLESGTIQVGDPVALVSQTQPTSAE